MQDFTNGRVLQGAIPSVEAVCLRLETSGGDKAAKSMRFWLRVKEAATVESVRYAREADSTQETETLTTITIPAGAFISMRLFFSDSEKSMQTHQDVLTAVGWTGLRTDPDHLAELLACGANTGDPEYDSAFDGITKNPREFGVKSARAVLKPDSYEGARFTSVFVRSVGNMSKSCTKQEIRDVLASIRGARGGSNGSNWTARNRTVPAGDAAAAEPKMPKQPVLPTYTQNPDSEEPGFGEVPPPF
jgi:hypothetical protein